MSSTTEIAHQVFGPAIDPAEDVPCRRGLSREQEREMAHLIARGSHAARNRMVQANLGLVVVIARQFLGRGLLLDDLVGEGNLGLIRAAGQFDPDFGTRFSTYANYWIKEAIRDALNNRTATIRLPIYMVRLLTKWRRTERALCQGADRMPNSEAVASSLGLNVVQTSLVRQAHLAGRLKPEGHGGGEAPGPSLDAATDQHGPVEDLLQADDERACLLRRMEGLDGRERQVLVLRYGMDGEPLTLREVGARLGLSGERVRKIELDAIRKLGGDYDEQATCSQPEQSARRDRCAGEGRNGIE